MAGLLSSASGLAITASGVGYSTSSLQTLQSFDIVNFDGVSSSNGFIRVGLPFKYGDVPSGSIPKIEKSGVEVAAVQFDERTFWPDGSLRYCVLHMRDSTFSASESRTYDVKTKSGSYSNTGTFSTSTITGSYDIKALLSSVQKCTVDTSDIAHPFVTVSGDATVTVKHTSHGRSVGDLVHIYTATEVGGLNFDDTYQIVATVPDANTFTFEAGSNATSSEEVTSTYSGTMGRANGGGQTGTSIVTDGWDASTVILESGDPFWIDGNKYTASAQISSDGSGAATITINETISGSIEDNDVVTWGAGGLVDVLYFVQENDHTGSLNTALGTATRITKIHSGPVCDGWLVWDYYVDDVATTDDAHLKAVWYVDVWNDGSDTDQGYVEVGCKTSQSNWKTTGKGTRSYTLTLKNSTTTIETYADVRHAYHAEWLTISKDGDNNDGRRQWLSTAPTLYTKPDQAYWVSTGLVPPLSYGDSDASFVDDDAAWVPGGNLNHRSFVDGTGAYMGRGMLPNSDAKTFIAPTAARTMYSRRNAHAGLHIPYHYKDEASRDRSGVSADDYNDFTAEGTDEAQTIFSLILEPKTSGEYTFTSDGMPAAVHAYADTRTNSTYANSFVAPIGGDKPYWQTSGDPSHAVNYSYYMYLLEGERYFMDATISLAQNVNHQHVGQDTGRDELLYYDSTNRQTDFSIPATKWSAIPGSRGGQERSNGWAYMLFGSAYAICPDNDVQANSLRAMIDHNLDYCVASKGYFPTAQNNWGIYWHKEDSSVSPWMVNFQVLGFWHMRNCSRTTDAQTMADHVAKFAINNWSNPGYYYHNSTYRGHVLHSKNIWHSTTNTYLDTPTFYAFMQDMTTDSTADTLSYSSYTTGAGGGTFEPADNDIILFMNENAGGTARAIPGGCTEGTLYYVINAASGSFQISATQGGSAINLTDDVTCCVVGYYPNGIGSVTTAGGTTGTPNADAYGPISRAALIAAHMGGNTGATSALVSAADTFMTNVDDSAWKTWSYSS